MTTTSNFSTTGSSNYNKPTANDVADEADDVISEVKKGARKAGNRASEFAHEAYDDLNGMAKKAGRRVRSALDGASEEVDMLTHKIEENPIQAALIALGVGFILGKITRL